MAQERLGPCGGRVEASCFSVTVWAAPLGPIVGPMMGFPPNMRELVKTSDVTITFKDDKARRELGYDGRPLEAGLRETVTA